MPNPVTAVVQVVRDIVDPPPPPPQCTWCNPPTARAAAMYLVCTCREACEYHWCNHAEILQPGDFAAKYPVPTFRE